MHTEEYTTWFPATEHDKQRVLEQMERLLETSHFRNSRRYPALFRFIVEETLEQRGEFLKERLLGVRVFGRPGDYDTASDPVVRVTVAEIRKRIAQYYHEENHAHELRIEFLPGRYEAEFRVSRDSPQPQDTVPVEPVVLSPEPVSAAPAALAPGPAAPAPAAPVPTAPTPDDFAAPLPASTPLPRRGLVTKQGLRSSRLFWGLLGGGLLAVLAMLAWVNLRVDALDRFWKPVLSAHKPVLLCLPIAGGKYGVAASSRILLPTQQNQSAAGTPAASGSYLALESLGENVVFSDVRATMDLSNLLAQHGVEQHLRLNTAVSMDDLRQGPVILIGAMDNPWTLRAISHLRYQFGGSNDETYWIVDTKAGKSTGWALDLKTPITSVTRDYAIIARIHAEDTGQQQIIIAGIGMSGTAAAGELLTNAAQMGALRRQVGRAFDDQDFEAVISTDVVNGIAGTPKVLTVEVQ